VIAAKVPALYLGDPPMAETKPRDLTMAEVELLKLPALRGTESMPLAIPPGTQTPVSLLKPMVDSVSSSGAPTAGPPDATAQAGPSHLK
jgi:hypothetical protein